jgi:enoyl-CoA hydratase
MGLLNKRGEVAELEDRVRQYATRMASNAPLTMAAAKATIREGLKDGANRDLKTIAEMVSRCFDSDDYREGVRAFMEKRQPRFAGR